MITRVLSIVRSALRRVRSRKGQTLVEYGMILALISVVAIGVMAALGGQIQGVFSTITSQVAMAGSSH